jgi:starch synthase
MGVSPEEPGKVIVSHPTGNANVTAVVTALNEAQLLEAFYTCILWRPDHPLVRLLPGSIRRVFERRARLHLPSDAVRTRPFRELMRNAAIRAGKKHWILREDHPFSIDSVYRSVDRAVAGDLPKFRGLRGVYAYEDGALHQFERARDLGIRCLYDLPIGYWRVNREISVEESELQPAWRGTLNALKNSDAKLARKDREIALADTIFVASSFTRKTLEAYPGFNDSVRGGTRKIVVVPYGTPAPVVKERALTDQDRDTGAPLRLIYVGSLTQRKGIAYLAEAVRVLGRAVTLTVIGRKVGQSDALDRFCAEHRWIESLPHALILEEIGRHDVLVFPSLFEGFGLVIGEALSRGVPVITTPHTGGPDILRDGQDGFIVPVRDAEAIVERVLALHGDRELLRTMSASALERAGQFTWQRYRDATVEAVRQALG